MYNYFMLIGKAVEEPKPIKNTDMLNFKLAVNRTFLNEKGEVTTDVFTIKICKYLADCLKENSKEGQTVMVKGRIAIVGNTIELIGERIMAF